MRFTYTVEVEVQRVQGKFATREEIAAQIQEALEGADPGSMTGDNEGEYEVADWSVNEEAPAKKPPKAKPAAAPATEAT